jgi:hypothetical protein
MHPIKLVLHFVDFSMIFYAIYKNQEITFYYWSSPFAAGTLERNFSSQCGPCARLLAGEGREKGLGASGARFGHLAGTVVAPASGAPAAKKVAAAAAVPVRGRLGWPLGGSARRGRSSGRLIGGSPTRAREGQRGGQRG